MKCSFKTVHINILFITLFAIIIGHGNSVEERFRNGLLEGRNIFLIPEQPEKLVNIYERMPERYTRTSSLDSPNLVNHNPKIYGKRNGVAFARIPSGISRRTEERPLIRQTNNDILGRRVTIRNLHTGRHTRRDLPFGWYQPNDSLREVRKENLIARTRLPDGLDCGGKEFEPCFASALPENAFNCRAKTYKVEVEQVYDDDDPSSFGHPQFPICNKYYYVFEKKPIKVKFLSSITSPECDNSVVKSQFPCNSMPLKLSMPAFQCRPPECREVLYCKYFQCTSLGFFPDTRNGRKYFFCDLNSNGFVLYHMLCPTGRIFDPVIRECRLKELIKRRDFPSIEENMNRMDKSTYHAGRSATDIHTDLPWVGEAGKNPEKVRRKRVEYEARDIINNLNSKQQGMKMMSSNALSFSTTGVPNEMQPIPNYHNCPPLNLSVMVPPPVILPIPNYYETTSLTPAPMTTLCQPHEFGGQTPSPPPPPSPEITYPVTTTVSTMAMTVATTTTTTSTTSTTAKTTIAAKEQVEKTQATQEPAKAKPKPKTQTIPICTQPPKKNTSQLYLEYNSGYPYDYSDDLLDDAYSNDYYSDEEQPEYPKEESYDWLKQSLYDYLDMLKLKNGSLANTTAKSNTQQSRDQSFNGNSVNREKEGKKLNGKENYLVYDASRGRRSEERNENYTKSNIGESTTGDLPDFEKCYNDVKRAMNLDGYPCKQYKRYPDKFDRQCYYECGAQPDGNMKIERRCCPQGEEFSPRFLECIATEYLKLAHRNKRFPKVKKSSKTKPNPEPEYNYEENEQPNEWADVPGRNELPKEFKSKPNTLRIFHLQNKRNLSHYENNTQLKKLRSVPEIKEHHPEVRSFIVRPDKKDTVEGPEGIDEDDDEEYEYEDEDYDDATEGGVSPTHWQEPYPAANSPRSNFSTSSDKANLVPETSTMPSKILLDADIRVDRDFEKALKGILGKSKPQDVKEKNGATEDSILIRLSSEKLPDRVKRNFLKNMFSKKPKANVDPDKEGTVNIKTLINALPSEYERAAILEKIERRKMSSSQLDKSQPYALMRGRLSRKNDELNELTETGLDQT